MAKLTLDDLRKMRGEKQKAMEMREGANKDVQVRLELYRPRAFILVASSVLGA